MEVMPKYSFANNLLKTAVFALISIGLVLGNYFLENSFAENDEAPMITQSGSDDSMLEDGTVIRNFTLDGWLKPAKPGKPKFENGYYNWKINAGQKIWGNFSISLHSANIFVDKVVMIPDEAVFDLAFDDKKIELNVYDGDVYVGFLNEKTELKNFADQYSNLFMNRILVPRGNQIIIPLKKVNDELEPLLYTKLVKEFKFSPLSEELKNSKQVQDNLTADKKLIEGVKQQFLARVIYEGTKVRSDFYNKFLFWSEENLTFVKEKNRKIIIEHLFNYLDDAIFYANQGNKVQVDLLMESFWNYYSALPAEVVADKLVFEKFDAYINDLRIFGPYDDEYGIKKALLEKKFMEGRERYQVVAAFWQDFYKALNNSESLAEQAIDLYFSYFDKIRVGYKAGADDLEFYKRFLTFQNQLFDNLFMKDSLFYQDGYFSVKFMIENDLLELYEESQLKGELRQALISNKISFMKRLKRFFFDGALEVKQAREIFERLFDEIDSLIPKNSTDLAVVELFESELEDMDDFYGYLDKSEYHSRKYGATHEDRYKIYLQERETIWNFVEIRENILGETDSESDIDVVDVVEEVEKQLYANKDVSGVEIAKFDQVNQRYLQVKLVLGGYPVEAVYDRDNGTVKDVKVYDELISDRALKIDKLLPILQEKFAELAENGSKNEEIDEAAIETAAQRYARKYIASKFSQLGFNATLENVKIVDQLNAIYKMEDVTFGKLEGMKLMFDVLMNGELVTNVFVNVKGEPRVLEGKYSFEELAALVQAEYDFTGKIEKKVVEAAEESAADGVPVADEASTDTGDVDVSTESSADGLVPR